MFVLRVSQQIIHDGVSEVLQSVWVSRAEPLVFGGQRDITGAIWKHLWGRRMLCAQQIVFLCGVGLACVCLWGHRLRETQHTCGISSHPPDLLKIKQSDNKENSVRQQPPSREFVPDEMKADLGQSEATKSAH